MISLVVAKPSSHCGKPSSNSRRRSILSLLLPQDWWFRGDIEGREHKVLCRWHQVNLGEWGGGGGGGGGGGWGTLGHWEKKTMLSWKQIIYISLIVINFLKITFYYILWCECLIYADDFWFISWICSAFRGTMWLWLLLSGW